MRLRRLARSVWFGLLLLATAGCPTSKGPAAICTKRGEQCQFDKNVLGVCEDAPKATKCPTPPCLVCTSQH